MGKEGGTEGGRLAHMCGGAVAIVNVVINDAICLPRST